MLAIRYLHRMVAFHKANNDVAMCLKFSLRPLENMLISKLLAHISLPVFAHFDQSGHPRR